MSGTGRPAFDAVAARLLAVPRWEGDFRVHREGGDVTDGYSELRFRDPRIGGYLDRTRVERDLRAGPLTVWLRGGWSVQAGPGAGAAAAGAVDDARRNVWTLLVPPGATARPTAPRRAFAVVRAVVGALADEDGTGAVRMSAGRSPLVRPADGDGLVAQVEWLAETSPESVERALGVAPARPGGDWHTAPVEDVVRAARERSPRR